MLIEVRPPAAGDDGRLAVATPFQIQTRDPYMWRFQRVDQHAVYDCELFLLWFIADPDGEREDDWNIWEIYDSDGLYLLQYYYWWGYWDIWDKNRTLPGHTWGWKGEQFIAKVRDRVRLFRWTLRWIHERDETEKWFQEYVRDECALLGFPELIRWWMPWKERVEELARWRS